MPTGDDKLSREVAEDIGGVQGTPPDQSAKRRPADPSTGKPAEQPAPDAGEIEWAGGLIKKAPDPSAD
jgi:hypothetical protein